MDASNRFGAAVSDGYVGATDLVGIMPPNGIETRAKVERGSRCTSITSIPSAFARIVGGTQVWAVDSVYARDDYAG
jgi:hypothetical protein